MEVVERDFSSSDNKKTITRQSNLISLKRRYISEDESHKHSYIEESRNQYFTNDSVKSNNNSYYAITTAPKPREINYAEESRVLISLLEKETFESGYETSSEQYVRSLLKEDRINALFWLNTLFIKNMDDPHTLVGILHILSHLDQKEVESIGYSIALIATIHKNIEVKDYGIKAFENWRGSDSLTILKNLEYEEKWLQEYVNELIKEMEEELRDDTAN